MADQNSQGGQGAAPAAPAAPAAAPAAPAAAPASSPSSSPSPAPQGAQGAPATGGAASAGPSGAPAPAAGAPSPAAGAPAAAPARVIESLPPRGSDEYWAKFDALSPEDKYKVESEWKDVDTGAAEGPKPADPNAPKDPAAQPLPGDKPAEGGEDLFLDEAFVAALPEREQKTVRAMQSTLDQFGDLMTPEFQEGMDRMVKDPIIKARMDELSTGKVWESAELTKDFDPGAYVKAAELERLDPVSDPEGYRAYHDKLTRTAYEDGLKKGSLATEYKMQQQVAFAERKSKFDVGFNKLAEVHPELKAKDPSVKEFNNPNHPMFPFLKWAAANYRDSFFMGTENAFEAAYASFLASGGKLNQAISSHVQRANLKFIRGVQEAQKTAATVGRQTSTSAPQAQALVPGIDADRYLSDKDYARQVYDRADHPTRQKLEALRYGRLTQTA